MRLGIAAPLQVRPEQFRLDAAVVLPPLPLVEVIVAEAIGTLLVREQGDDAVLRPAFGAGCSSIGKNLELYFGEESDSTLGRQPQPSTLKTFANHATPEMNRLVQSFLGRRAALPQPEDSNDSTA